MFVNLKYLLGDAAVARDLFEVTQSPDWRQSTESSPSVVSCQVLVKKKQQQNNFL